MIAVVQRVTYSSVKIEGEIKGEINDGFMVLLGISQTDNEEQADWLARKIVGLRVFSDEEGKMNKDLKDIDGNILLISQFTLHAAVPPAPKIEFEKPVKSPTGIVILDVIL